MSLTRPEISANATRFYADWLKLRGCLVDPETRLASLPMVLDDVRRRLEAGESLAVVYLDFSTGGSSEVACGWQLYDRLLTEAAGALVDFCAGTGSADDLIAQLGVRSDVFLIFAEAADGEAIERLHRGAVEALTHRIETVLGDELPSVPAVDSAVVPLRPEPNLRLERAIYTALRQAREVCRQHGEARLGGRRAELDRMLAERDLETRFQPIFDLDVGPSRRMHGVEALSRAPSRDVFDNAEELFSFAEEHGGIVELERLCRRLTLERGAALLGAGAAVFVNCSAHAFFDPRLVADLITGADEAGVAPERIVLEVTERVAITEWEAFRGALAAVRSAGLRVAIDDMGSGYSSLQAVAEIQPDYLKFDLTLVRGIDSSPIKRDLFETLRTLAHKIGAQPIAEGIETESELECVRALGVGLGQGYLLARPVGAAEFGPQHVEETP
ncbi:MAG: EAL domain-containing protein [Acidobacteriota bacterium]